MPRHLAFLRAVNVAGRTVPMAQLRERLTAAGFRDVATHIQTGNVAVGTSMRSQAKVERVVEEALADWLGFEVPTMVRSPRELADTVEAIESTPHLLEGGGRRYVAFAKDVVTAQAVRELTAYDATPERARVLGRDVLLEIGGDFHTAKLAGAKLERLAGTALTARDLKVVRAISEKWSST